MKEDTGTYSIQATGGTSEAHVQVDCEHSLSHFFLLVLFCGCYTTENLFFFFSVSLLLPLSYFHFTPLHRVFGTVKPLKILQDLQDITVRLGQPLKLHCEILPGNVPGRWYRNGQLIQSSDRINIIHRAKYNDASKTTPSSCIQFMFTILNPLFFVRKSTFQHSPQSHAKEIKLLPLVLLCV